MEALRFIPETSSFSLESNVGIPKIQNADDVLVEVHFAGLCGTDIHIQQVSCKMSQFFEQSVKYFRFLEKNC